VTASETYTASSQSNPDKSWIRRVFSGLQHAMGTPVATGGDLVHIADTATGRIVVTLETPFGDEGDLLARVTADLASMTGPEFEAAYEIER
jgi:hypothetical protein